MSEWQKTSLKQAGVVLLDCDHKTPTAREFGRPYVGIPQMTTGRVDFSTARLISEEDFVTWTRKTKPQRDDVILSRRTNPGVTAVDDSGTEFALGQNLVLLRANGKAVFPPFLRWLVRTPEWWSEIEKYINVGAVFSSLRCGDVPNFELSIPPLSEQKKIESMLRPLDDKIELNRRMNETLEGMAQAIFKDWFVDFGPVRRKLAGVTDPAAIMGGLTPARAPELAALFPDGFGDDGLPEGWTKKEIGSLVDIAGGSTPSTADKALWEPAEHWWATPKDLSSMSDLALFSTERRISSAGLSRITSGVLPVGTVLLSSRAPIGYLAVAQVPVSINQGFIALKPNNVFGSPYLYLWCKANMDQIVANANGSTFQEISKKNFRPITTALPLGPSIVKKFCKICQPLIDRIVLAAQENRTLAETRDYLLPKLMSGEVRVRVFETPGERAGI